MAGHALIAMHASVSPPAAPAPETGLPGAGLEDPGRVVGPWLAVAAAAFSRAAGGSGKPETSGHVAVHAGGKIGRAARLGGFCKSFSSKDFRMWRTVRLSCRKGRTVHTLEKSTTGTGFRTGQTVARPLLIQPHHEPALAMCRVGDDAPACPLLAVE
jgi:hypothetical protein